MKPLNPPSHRPNPARKSHETGAYQGDPNVEVLERVRRLETRVTNAMRSVGLMPGASPPDPLRGTAVYADGAVHVSSPNVPLGEVAKAAVRGADRHTNVVQIILCNQLWGSLRIHGFEDTPPTEGTPQ